MNNNSCSIHEKFDTIFMGLFLLLVPRGQVPPGTCKGFLHLDEGGALCAERATSEFRLVTFSGLDETSNNRKMQSLSSTTDLSSSQSTQVHSRTNTSLSTRTPSFKVKYGVMKMCTKC